MSEVSAASLQGRIAQRRAALEQQEAVTLDVPVLGIKAKYGPIDFRKTVAIEERHAGEDTADMLLNIAADKLINSCQGLYQEGADGLDQIKLSDGEAALWNEKTVREFGVELPAGVGSREALLTLFEGYEEELATHARDWAQATAKKLPEITEQLAGESPAAA